MSKLHCSWHGLTVDGEYKKNSIGTDSKLRCCSHAHSVLEYAHKLALGYRKYHELVEEESENEQEL